jgi:hypothetical protein
MSGTGTSAKPATATSSTGPANSAGLATSGAGSLGAVGNITKALLDALSQIEQYVAAGQIGPDGKPLSTAIYMHLPNGVPIDPKMYANAWTPGGGDSSSSFGDDGTFVAAPAQQATASTPAPGGAGPAGSMYPPPPPAPDQQLEASIQNAMNTSILVDQMLEVTQNGVAVAWPDRNVSVEYFSVLKGMQPLPGPPPAQNVVNAVAAAQSLLYLQDNNGNFIGYTQLYAQYRKNRTAWLNAVAAQAAAYAQAMADPVAGQAWPIVAQSYANTVQLALDDFNSMGRQKVEDALDTIATQGESAVTALVALAHQMYDAYSIQAGGSISTNVQWSFINPNSWWDSTDESFGVQKITGTSSGYDSKSTKGTASFANQWQQQQSMSASASGGFNVGFASASASGSHADASNSSAAHAGQYTWSSSADKSTTASVSMEFFLAEIDRPWLLGDIFNIGGWYLVQQRKNSISDGTVANQIGQNTPALLPMIPMAFLIIRNVSITADDFGDAGRTFTAAQQNAASTGQSSANSIGVKASYLFSSASANYAGQQSSGAFGSDATTSGITFTSDNKNGGTFTLSGSQICGWVGQIQLASPRIDDPTLPPLPKSSQTNGSSASN